MLQVRREVVYTRLDPLPFRALQGAFELAWARDNAYVELAHWLNQIMMLPDSDLHRIAAAFDIDLGGLTRDLSQALERIRKGGTDLPDFSEHVDRAIERCRLAVVDCLHHRIARENTPGIPHQQLQDVELEGR